MPSAGKQTFSSKAADLKHPCLVWFSGHQARMENALIFIGPHRREGLAF